MSLAQSFREDFMKKYFVVMIIISVFSVLDCTKIKTFFKSNNEENKIIIKTMGIEMVAPSKNKKAMNEFIDGTQLLNDGDYEKAEEHLKKAIKLDPLFVDAFDHLENAKCLSLFFRSVLLLADTLWRV